MCDDEFEEFPNDDDTDAGFVQAQMKVIFDELMCEKLEQRIVGKLAQRYGQNEDESMQIESPIVRILRQVDERTKRDNKEQEDQKENDNQGRKRPS